MQMINGEGDIREIEDVLPQLKDPRVQPLALKLYGGDDSNTQDCGVCIGDDNNWYVLSHRTGPRHSYVWMRYIEKASGILVYIDLLNKTLKSTDEPMFDVLQNHSKTTVTVSGELLVSIEAKPSECIVNTAVDLAYRLSGLK